MENDRRKEHNKVGRDDEKHLRLNASREIEGEGLIGPRKLD